MKEVNKFGSLDAAHSKSVCGLIDTIDVHGILRSTNDIVFLNNFSGIYSDVFALDEQLLLLPSKEIIGKNIRVILPENALRDALEQIEICKSGKRSFFSYELNINNQKSLFNAVLIKVNEESFITLVNVRTDFENLQWALAKSEQTYQQLIEQMPSAVLRCEVVSRNSFDEIDLKIISANPGFQKLNNNINIEIIGNTLKSLFSKIPQWLQVLLKAAYNNESVNIDSYDSHWDKWVHCIAYPASNKEFVIILSEFGQSATNKLLMQKNEERYRFALNNSKSIVWEWLILSNQLFWSDNFYELLGYNKHEISMHWKNIAQLVHPKEYKYLVEVFQNFLGNQCAELRVQFRLRKGNGKYTWFELRGKEYKNNTTIGARIIGSCIEINQSKETERELLILKEYYRQALSLSHIAYWNYFLDERKLLYSKGLLKLMGIDNEERAYTFEDIVSIAVCPDDQQLIIKMKSDFHSGALQDEVTIDFKVLNNSDIVYIRGKSVLLRDESNNVIGVFGTIQDISEEKNAEMQILNESRLSQLIMQLSSNYINLPLSQVDDAINKALEEMGRFVGADRCYIFDYDFDKQVCTNTYEWCDVDISPQIHNSKDVSLSIMPHWLDIHLKGEINVVPDAALFPDIGLREIFLSQDIKSLLALPFINENQCLGFVGFDFVRTYHVYNNKEQQVLRVFANMLLNIILRQQADAELIAAKIKAEESDRLKTAFLANMSHEIRTPLNSIVGFASLLTDESYSNDEKSEFIKRIDSNSNQLLHLISDIIDFAKIESGTMSINIERVNIFNLLTSTTSNLSIQCPPEIKFVININSMLKGCEILVDANRLIQVLNNIINNAFKFTSRGSVHFEALFNQTKTHVVIKVKDTGIGISKKALPYIFNRFYQSDRINDGTGLGLAICKSLIESMNGNISVTSEVNRGSLFVISIPC